MSKYTDRKFGLPPRPTNTQTRTCGICESMKSELLGDEGALICPHCDTICRVPVDESCPICQAGMKGLPDPEVRAWWDQKGTG